MHIRNCPVAIFFLVFPVLVAVPVVAFKIHERNFRLSVVPDALKVSSITYSEEASWGFGPGGNEVGIRTYPLSEDVADQIRARGLEFFNSLPENKNRKDRKWRGQYPSWHETPIKESRHWKRNGEVGLEIDDYICRYGFCVDIDEWVSGQAANIINSEGSYYAYGRIRLIVVSPARKIVIYMYNG